jgi:hypothetical protein
MNKRFKNSKKLTGFSYHKTYSYIKIIDPKPSTVVGGSVYRHDKDPVNFWQKLIHISGETLS